MLAMLVAPRARDEGVGTCKGYEIFDSRDLDKMIQI